MASPAIMMNLCFIGFSFRFSLIVAKGNALLHTSRREAEGKGDKENGRMPTRVAGDWLACRVAELNETLVPFRRGCRLDRSYRRIGRSLEVLPGGGLCPEG